MTSFIFGDITGYFIIVGVVSLIISLGFLWIVFHFVRILKAKADLEERYAHLEIGFIRNVAENNKINLEKEKSLLSFKVNKTFRGEIEKKLIKEIIKESNTKEKK